MLSEMVQKVVTELAVVQQQLAVLRSQAEDHNDRQREADGKVDKLHVNFDERLTKLENFAISARTALTLALSLLALMFYARDEFLAFVVGLLQ